MTDNMDGGKIFIWGQIGELLKQIDSERMLCIAQLNANYAMGIRANEVILDVVHQMKNGKSFSDIKKTIDRLNYLDDLFRQIQKFLHEKPYDLLSIGSFVAGEIESKTGMLDLGGDSN